MGGCYSVVVDKTTFFPPSTCFSLTVSHSKAEKYVHRIVPVISESEL
jgi:hypothetical protein